MQSRSKTNNLPTPPKKFGGGPDQKFTSEAWNNLAVSQCRREMLRILVKSDIGLNEVEDYNTELNLKLKSKALRDQGPLSDRGVVRAAMRKKLKDENHVVDELTRERDKVRRKIKSKFGNKSVKTKAIIKTLKSESDIVRVDLRLKYKNKMAHLKQKFDKKRKQVADKPTKYDEFKMAKVYDKEKFDGIEVGNIEVCIVGDIDLSEEERECLKLHPKFAIRDKITDEELDFQQELGFAKLRYSLLKEEEEAMDSDDEDEENLTEEEKKK